MTDGSAQWIARGGAFNRPSANGSVGWRRTSTRQQTRSASSKNSYRMLYIGGGEKGTHWSKDFSHLLQGVALSPHPTSHLTHTHCEWFSSRIAAAMSTLEGGGDDRETLQTGLRSWDTLVSKSLFLFFLSDTFQSHLWQAKSHDIEKPYEKRFIAVTPPIHKHISSCLYSLALIAIWLSRRCTVKPTHRAKDNSTFYISTSKCSTQTEFHRKLACAMLTYNGKGLQTG